MKEKLTRTIRKRHFYGPLGAGLFLSILFFLIGSSVGGENFGTTLVMAALLGFSWIVSMMLEFSEAYIIEKKVSLDKVVVAQVINLSTGPRPYLGQVTRSYADGVFKREESFTSVDKAKVWLGVVYDEELTKHLLKVSIKEKEMS